LTENLALLVARFLGLGTDRTEDPTGRKDCTALHCICKTAACFFPFFCFCLGIAVRRGSLEGVLLHQFMVEFWCPLPSWTLDSDWFGLFGVSVLGMPEISLLPANLVDLGIKANTHAHKVENPELESWGFCGAHFEHL